MTILIVYHSQGGQTGRMARAVAQGVSQVEGVTPVLKKAGKASLEDLFSCAGVVLGSPEYFGYMAGAVKDFLDRTYYPSRDNQAMVNKAYGVFICAGNDGSGALRSMERIAGGYPLKQVCPPVISRGGVDEADLEACRELGRTIAAGCEFGIF